MPAREDDPVRTLTLLWRGYANAGPDDGRRRGPAPRLDVEQVVRTATALADAGGPGGLEALTMRRLAAELGVAAMTLYTYVPGKAELGDLVLDAAHLAMPRTDTTGRAWRARVTAVADENRALFAAHPWAAFVDTSRPVLGPGSIGKYEHELAAFDDAGLDDVDRDAALTFVLDWVTAQARAAADATVGADAQWWAVAGPALARVLDADRYPRATRVGAAAGAAQGSARHPDHAWRFGWARVLDGLSALVDR